jgi:hypothetical protein
MDPTESKQFAERREKHRKQMQMQERQKQKQSAERVEMEHHPIESLEKSQFELLKAKKQSLEKWEKHKKQMQERQKKQKQQPTEMEEMEYQPIESSETSPYGQELSLAKKQYSERWEKYKKQMQERQQKQKQEKQKQQQQQRTERVKMEHQQIEHSENCKKDLQKASKKLHDSEKLADIYDSLDRFVQTLERCLPNFQEYELEEVKEIVMRAINGLKEELAEINVIKDRELYHQLQLKVKDLLQLMDLPEDMIHFELIMDTSRDLDFAEKVRKSEMSEIEYYDSLYAQYLSGQQLTDEEISQLISLGYDL